MEVTVSQFGPPPRCHPSRDSLRTKHSREQPPCPQEELPIAGTNLPNARDIRLLRREIVDLILLCVECADPRLRCTIAVAPSHEQ